MKKYQPSIDIAIVLVFGIAFSVIGSRVGVAIDSTIHGTKSMKQVTRAGGAAVEQEDVPVAELEVSGRRLMRAGDWRGHVVSPGDAWDVKGTARPPAPDRSRKPEYTPFILKGRFDTSDVDARELRIWMEENNLTEEDLKVGQ